MSEHGPGHGTLGINGLGRIGKLSVWYEAARRRFERLVVNTGRPVGRGLGDLLAYLEHDSTYGTLARFLHGGLASGPAIEVVDEASGRARVNGVELTFLTTRRNPREIGWAAHGARLVVDTTGAFLDPTLPAEHPGGSLRGHLEAGARVVVTSAAFKIKDKASALPGDSLMLIQGINEHAFDPSRHSMVSAASCTTTALAHMLRPLLEHELTHGMLTASMSTIHAATNSQSVLDTVPKTGSKDLRKTRSALNNIILTSTNAARALDQVMPDIADIGFLADSVRVPIPTASLIILNCTFQSRVDDSGASTVNRDAINTVYRRFAEAPASGVVVSDLQNVSTDMIGEPAAVVIEAVETHTRTGFLKVDLRALGIESVRDAVEVPVTHAKIFGWYDNELGSYCRRMAELVAHIADRTL